MEQNLFRQKSIDQISSPEQLGDYLHVTAPAAWVVLGGILLLLAALLIWSGVTAVESYAAGTAEVRGGVLTLSFDDPEKAARVEAGMNIRVGQLTVPVLAVGSGAEGTAFAVGHTDLPDGSYDARVGYTSTQIIRMLFN